MSLIWTWPLALHFNDHIPGHDGDNYSFLWNLWWMRKALSAPELEFFQSRYLFSPFGVDLVNQPHTALQGFISATALRGLSVIQAENLYIILSVFLNAVCAYALAFDIVRNRRAAILAGMAFGGSPYISAHLLGHFDLLTAWVIPLFALCLRRSLKTGSVTAAVGCGLSVAVAAYAADYYVVYLALFAVTYLFASWHVLRVHWEPRPQKQSLFTARLIIVGVMAMMSAGIVIHIFDVAIPAMTVQKPLLVLWLLALAWFVTKRRVRLRFQRPSSEPFWRGAQAMMITVATVALVALPLVAQTFRLGFSGRYASQTYFWRSAPRGVDALVPLAGNPFHPMYGRAVTMLYENLGLDRIEAVGWIGIAPVLVLLMRRGTWFDSEEARRWKIVLIVFAVWALGPSLGVAGTDMGLPLPQALARYLPLADNARLPGRAMVCVYLALGVLMALRVAGLKPCATPTSVSHAPVAQGSSPGFVWVAIVLLAIDYLPAPIPLTRLDRPAVYEQLATITDSGAVIEVPFGIGDGLSSGRGSQNRRLLYHAIIHGHPVVGGYIARMPSDVARAYDAMPVVGNLLRLSNGESEIEEDAPMSLPFRYLVLDTTTASPELVGYVMRALDMDLISSGGGRELYAVQGARPTNIRASR